MVKFTKYLELQNFKKFKAKLQDIWRDTHFWRLKEDEVFEKIARNQWIKSQPKLHVKRNHL